MRELSVVLTLEDPKETILVPMRSSDTMALAVFGTLFERDQN